MTTSSYTKAFTQLDAKPVIRKKFTKHNKPKERKCGTALRKCRRCGRTAAYISKYKIGLCRQCFRETAKILGFKKYN